MRIFSLLSIVAAGLFVGGCAADPVVVAEALQQKIGEKVYLKNNIWFTDPAKISCLNIQQGSFLPVGTEVEPVRTTACGDIVFKDKNNRTYTIKFSEGTALTSMREYVKTIFTTTPPEEFLKGIDPNVLLRIKRGEAVAGMTRKEVILTYGYPPAERTPDLRNESWIYWITDSRTIRVIFRGDTVTKIVEY